MIPPFRTGGSLMNDPYWEFVLRDGRHYVVPPEWVLPPEPDEPMCCNMYTSNWAPPYPAYVRIATPDGVVSFAWDEVAYHGGCVAIDRPKVVA